LKSILKQTRVDPHPIGESTRPARRTGNRKARGSRRLVKATGLRNQCKNPRACVERPGLVILLTRDKFRVKLRAWRIYLEQYGRNHHPLLTSTRRRRISAIQEARDHGLWACVKVTFDGVQSELRIPSTSSAVGQLLRLLQGVRGRAGWIGGRADTDDAKGCGARKKKNMKRGIELERRPRGLYTLRGQWRSRESGVTAHHPQRGDLAGALNRIGASSTGGRPAVGGTRFSASRLPSCRILNKRINKLSKTLSNLL
jgi:hypothetical protein